MGRVLAIANQKGGVGKTTTAVNLAASLAVAEQQVLLIDLDPQGNASTGVGVSTADIDAGAYRVLLDEVEIADELLQTEMPQLHVLPSTQDLVAIERELVDAEDSAERLRNALASIGAGVAVVVVVQLMAGADGVAGFTPAMIGISAALLAALGARMLTSNRPEEV